MEIHFYPCKTNDSEVIHSYYDTEKAISKRQEVIKTSQMMLLSTQELVNGYRIFIHDCDGEFEIRLGDCDRTERLIREGHNIAHLWRVYIKEVVRNGTI